ncbi:MAG TPA: GNAT family N-acetyltransferase [Acidimicrobiales bacterium]
MSSTRHVAPFTGEHTEQLAGLVNAHLDAVVPGFTLPPDHLASRLLRNPAEMVVDPWVVRRRTLVAVDRDRVVAAAHLLHYGATGHVGPGFRNAGEIAWLVAWPSARDAAEALLTAGLTELESWGTEPPWLCTGSMFVPAVSGIPDTWPHIAAVVRAAGFVPDPEREEILYAGRIDHVAPAPAPPIEGLALARRMADFTPRFAAELDGEAVGLFDVSCDATEGGRRPALAGWAEPWNVWVDEPHRSRGIGSWLVRAAVPYLRLAGCDRMVVTTAVEDERAGAGRFYERLGLTRLARLDRAWSGADRHGGP